MSTDGILSTVEPVDGNGVLSLDHDYENSDSYVIQLSQGQTTYFVSLCSDGMKPIVSTVFSSLDEGISFYKTYATECGFGVRNGCCHKDKKDGVVILKYLVCSREGFKLGQRNSGKQSRVSNRVGCIAKIVFRFAGKGAYVVKSFEERHTHSLVANNYKQFMKTRRNLDIGHKKFVLNCSKANIGPVKSHRLYKEIVGGYAHIGASATDFKNFKRDMLAFFNGSDSQTVINSLFGKHELCSAFYFDYDVDSSDRLTRLFWADPISRKNFAFFGEVVSFDATYRTNRYDLIFAPFTGLDHHKRCVTFGVGVVFKEDKDSYVWVLENFKKAMGHDLKIFVTDQDLSMKGAVAQVFPNTRHRLCMWHIMQKVPSKTKHDSKAADFRKKLNSLVWTHELEPAEFEEEWLNLINEYPLDNKKWFFDMFAIRQLWIPAYFRDVMFGGLVRTTSISEVQNNFFGHFTDRYFRLVELLMHYESALDAQRHSQAKLNHECETMLPDLKTMLKLEKHAREVYTLAVFNDIQKEISDACFSCCIIGLHTENEIVTYTIKEGGLPLVKVVYHRVDGNVVCSCRMFQRIGVPCHHMFVVFKNMEMEEIPTKFVLSRWTKSATITPIFSIDGTLVEQCFEMEERKVLMNTLMSDFYCCMGIVEDNPDQLKDFSRLIKDAKSSLVDNSGSNHSSGSSNVNLAEAFVGTKVPTTISVLPPQQAKNKGSGKRITSCKEI